jgi:cytochrome P450
LLELYPGQTDLDGEALFGRLLELGSSGQTLQLEKPIPHSLINSYEGARQALECPERFCSEYGIGLYPKPPIQGCSLNLSPPHIAKPLRRKVGRWLQRRLDLKKSAIDELAMRLVDCTMDDFVAEVSDPLAWKSLALVLEIDPEQSKQLHQASLSLAEAQSSKAIGQADQELLDLLRNKPITPAFGMDENDRLYLGRLLMVTGWLSNSAALARGMHLLSTASNSENDYHQLLNQSNLADELFRLTSPVARIGRSELSPEKNRRVMVNLAAANRDARQFPNASSISPNKQPVKHLAFGHGIHRCLGEALAQTSLRAMLTALKFRMKPTCEIKPIWRRSSFILGYQQLKLVWTSLG